MYRNRTLAALVIGLALILAVDGSAETRVGVATVDITPPVGMPMAGYYHARGAEGTLDPLYCKALVIEQDGVAAALVALDTIIVTRSITDQARQQIEATVSIPPTHVLISATHAHTGPELPRESQRVEDMGGKQEQRVEYAQALAGKIADCVKQACDAMQPAQLSTARGTCEGLAFNRRYFMRDGSVGWNPGKLNPDIMLPAGPTDPEVGILYVERPEAQSPDQSLATYVNFAMHTDTTGGKLFSADWPGALSRSLADYHGSHHVTLLGNGPSGNVNHCDFSWKWLGSGPGEQKRIGTILAASVFQTYKSLQPMASSPLAARAELVELELPAISPEEVEEARQIVADTKDDRGANFMKLVRAYRALDVARREGQPYRVEVQAISLGRDVAWVGLPGEVFVELGLAIKKRSPFELTMVVSLANENIGYVPDRRSYAEGNYEPESARCAPGSGERLVDAAVTLLDQLRQTAGN